MGMSGNGEFPVPCLVNRLRGIAAKNPQISRIALKSKPRNLKYFETVYLVRASLFLDETSGDC